MKGPALGLSLPGDFTFKDIEELGYRIYIYPTDSHQASVAAMFEAMSELQKTGTTKGYFDRHPRIAPEIFEKMVRTDEWLELDKKYIPKG